MTSIATEHIRELAARKSKMYDLFLDLEQNPQADDSCFQSLAQIVDRILFHEISLDGGALKDFRELVGASEAGSILAVLSLALAGAEPERGSIDVLLAGYPKWLRAVSGTARPHFLGILPNIAALLKELQVSGVEAVIGCLNTCASPEDFETFARCVAGYQETSGSILIAAAEIASAAVRSNSRPLVEKLISSVTPEAMLDSKPARELLPALAMLKTPQAMAVCVAVAAHNHSSALNLARRIHEDSVGYLNSFQRIVEEVGVSMIGYGTKQLPVLFQTAGEERAAQFVEQGISIARRYGRLAAEEYFEQKTAASKLFSSQQASPSG
jgi:hypothetical protein